MNANKLIAHWDVFEGDHAEFQDAITRYLCSIKVSPCEVMICGDASRIWNINVEGGLSVLYRLDILDEPGKLVTNLEVCVGIVNADTEFKVKSFLLGFNRDLIDFKCAVSREGHVIGTFVSRIENLKIEHFTSLVSELIDFGTYLQAQLAQFNLLPLKIK